jgi:uncharacterized protein YjbI with pentapeptide repeats
MARSSIFCFKFLQSPIIKILTIILIGVPSFTLLILFPFLLIIQASSFITSKSCTPNPNAKFFLQVLMATGFKKQLRGANICNQTLGFIDLSEANLTGANLKDSNFAGSNLKGVVLKGANLQNTFLSGVNFQNSFLEGANFQNSKLNGAIFNYADLMKTNFKGANLKDVHFKGADLSGADLEGALNLTKEQIDQALLCNTKLPKYIVDIRLKQDCVIPK